MLFYVALVWNEADPSKQDVASSMLRRFMSGAQQWQIALQQEGLAVCYRSSPLPADIDPPYVLPNGRGVVFGKLFDKSYADRDDTHRTPPSPVVLDERRSALIVASAGRALVDNYWGQYVAFLRNTPVRKTWVLRDPAGRIPCQLTRINNIDVYFVRLEDSERLGAANFSINRRYLLGYLASGNVCTRYTGLNEIESVLPGECVEHHADRQSRTFYWNPLQIAERDVIEDAAEATRLMRRTVRSNVHAWASCFKGMELSLSGGLDSSIIASCLTDAPTHPRVVCRNTFSLEPSTDERRYARAVAARTGFELFEEEANADPEFDSIGVSLGLFRRSPYPYPWWFHNSAQDLADASFLTSRGLTAIFRGDAGDEIFVTNSHLPTVVDYFRRHGVTQKLFSTALDDAIVQRTSIWRVLKQTYRQGFRNKTWHMRRQCWDESPLMRPEAAEEAHRDFAFWHPLFKEASSIPPAKFGHAYLLTSGTAHGYIPSAVECRNPPSTVAPLRSQPLLELSLRIPMYVLMSGGQNRTIARRAFSADVPQEIILRNTKSVGTNILQTILFKRIALARELLLDGYLVREGFVDKDKLEAVLLEKVSRTQSHTIELGSYLDVEAWVRSWNKTPREAAA